MTTSGSCRALRDSAECIDEFMISYRNRALAEKAWIRNKHRYCNRSYMKEFKDGFIQGYMEVASGGNGCIPAVAPSEYWGWKYQSTHGHSAVNAWFEGFPMGVQAAEQDGVGHWGQIRTSGVVPNPPAPLAPAAQMQNSGGVTNPFYSDEEIIPAPEPIREEDLESMDVPSEPDFREPESVYHDTMPSFPFAAESDEDNSELVSQLDIAQRHEAAVAASMGDQSEDAYEPADVVIDDIFGAQPTTSDSDSQELPFSFE